MPSLNFSGPVTIPDSVLIVDFLTGPDRHRCIFSAGLNRCIVLNSNVLEMDGTILESVLVENETTDHDSGITSQSLPIPIVNPWPLENLTTLTLGTWSTKQRRWDAWPSRLHNLTLISYFGGVVCRNRESCSTAEVDCGG